MEEMYLVHGCGEAFDGMDVAAEHINECEQFPENPEFDLLPESEAM